MRINVSEDDLDFQHEEASATELFQIPQIQCFLISINFETIVSPTLRTVASFRNSFNIPHIFPT